MQYKHTLLHHLTYIKNGIISGIVDKYVIAFSVQGRCD